MIRTTEILTEICQDKNLLNKNNINTYKKYIKENPNKRSFIYRDILFISRNEKVYAVKLPYNGILGSRDRYNESQNYMKSQSSYLNYCIHMFLTQDEINANKNEAIKRAKYKRIEHSSGDNTKETKRIVDGINGEFAVEKFINMQATDFSAPTLDSRVFDVPDIPELGCGVKTTSEDYLSFIAEPNQKTGQIISTILNNTRPQCDCVVIRGYISKEEFYKKENQSYNTITQNSLLVKSIMFHTKIGFQFPIDTYNQVDVNKISGTDKYHINNIVLGDDINLDDLSESVIKTLKDLRDNSQSMILYVNINHIDKSLNSQYDLKHLKRLLSENNSRMQKIAEISSLYKIGIVFYDNFTYQNMKGNNALAYFPNYITDKYCIGTIDKYGRINK